MEIKFWSMAEIVEILEVREELIATLEKEQIITFCFDEKQNRKLLPSSELEKLQVAKTLIEEMDVNLPGVEVGLQMRQNYLEMRCQFDEILKNLVEEFKELLNRQQR
jgi:MerR family transcriptional regulator, heat shock protein HspR